jgi:hypothetical protein
MTANRIGKAALAAGGAALLASTPATAADHYYFNKPGVDRDAYAADVAECAELAGGARAKPQGGVVYVSYQNTTAGAAGAAIGLLFAGLLSASAAKKERRMMRRTVERTCMADKGYARMAVEDEVVEDIEKVTDENQRLDKMFALAASAQPIGKRIKE